MSGAKALEFLAGFADVERGDRPLGGLSLDRTREILAALGHPERRYPSVIIAGTNGKGSTAAIVERGLRAAGLKTGLYTQPHLHTIRERVRIDGQPISPDTFDAAIVRIRAALDQVCDASRPTTAYEVMTTLALNHFAEVSMDVAVLEVGLGGRLDSTNVVDATVSALTPISLDHTQILGETIAAIAAEKADVIKPGRVCVSARQHPDAFAVIRRVAASRGSRLRIAEEDGASWDEPPQEWDLLTDAGLIPNLSPRLRGTYQRTNIAIAASILDALRAAGVGAIPLDAVRAGIEEAQWPGRFEIVEGPTTIVIDGAHNVAAATALREALDRAYPDQRRLFVLGILADKDVSGIVHALLAPGQSEASIPASLVIATRPDHPRAVDSDAIASAAQAWEPAVERAPTVAAALQLARERATEGDLIVVAGSLYVVAEAREALGLAEAADESPFNPWASR